MNKHTTHSNDLSTLAEDARDLLAATVDVAGDKVGEARKRLAAALESAKSQARATDKAIHENPYKAVAIAAGAGFVIGYFLAGRCYKKVESGK